MNTDIAGNVAFPRPNCCSWRHDGVHGVILGYREIEETQCFTQVRVVRLDVVGNSGGKLSSMFRHGPLRYSNLAHLDIDILPHLAGIRFGRPGGSEAWRHP